MVPVSGATGGLSLGSEEDQGELLARCVPLGGAVGLEITAAEPFSKRFVWSEDHKNMEGGRMLGISLMHYGQSLQFEI